MEGLYSHRIAQVSSALQSATGRALWYTSGQGTGHILGCQAGCSASRLSVSDSPLASRREKLQRQDHQRESRIQRRNRGYSPKSSASNSAITKLVLRPHPLSHCVSYWMFQSSSYYIDTVRSERVMSPRLIPGGGIAHKGELYHFRRSLPSCECSSFGRTIP